MKSGAVLALISVFFSKSWSKSFFTEWIKNGDLILLLPLRFSSGCLSGLWLGGHHGLILLVGTFWRGGRWEQGLQHPRPCSETLMDRLALSRSAPLLFQIVGTHGKIGGAIEPMSLETSCLKCTAAFGMARLSTSTASCWGHWWFRFALVPAHWYLPSVVHRRQMCMCLCKSIISQGSSCALLVNVPGFTLGRWGGAGLGNSWCGWRCCLWKSRLSLWQPNGEA